MCLSRAALLLGALWKMVLLTLDCGAISPLTKEHAHERSDAWRNIGPEFDEQIWSKSGFPFIHRVCVPVDQKAGFAGKS